MLISITGRLGGKVLTVEELQIIVSDKTKTAQENINKLKKSVDNLQQNKTTEINVNTTKAQATLKRLQAEYDKTQAKVDKIKSSMANAFAAQDTIAENYNSLPAFTGQTKSQSVDTALSQDTGYQKISGQITDMEAALAPLQAKLDETKAKMAEIGNQAEKASKKTKSLGESLKSTGNQSSYFSRMIKSMLISMALFSGISLIMKSITEGLQNFAKGNTSANQTLSSLATSFLYVKNSIAAAFMPVLQALTPALTGVMNKVADFFNLLGMLEARLFNNATTFTEAKSATVDYAQSLNTASKAAKGSLASFDQINTLQNPDTSTTATPGMPDPSAMMQQVQIPQNVLTLADTLKKISDTIGIYVIPALAAIGIAFITYKGILLGIQIANGITAGTFFTISLPLLAITGGVALLAFSLITLITQWGNLDGAQRTVLIGIGILGAALIACGAAQLIFNFSLLTCPIFWFVLGIAAIVAIIVILVTSWNSLSMPMKIVLIAIGLLIAAVVIYAAVQWAMNAALFACPITWIILGIMALIAIVVLLVLNWSSVVAFFQNLWNDIVNIFKSAWDWLNTGIGQWVTVIIAIINPFVIPILIIQHWTQIKDFFVGLWGDLTSGFKSFINLMIDGINVLIRALDKIQFTMPDWLGGGSFGITLPILPHWMAKGGIVNGPTPAIIGENGSEAVMPLENNTGWITKLALDINSRMNGNDPNTSNGSGDTYLQATIVLDSGEIIGNYSPKINRTSRNNNQPVINT
jgi:hypothetical protein